MTNVSELNCTQNYNVNVIFTLLVQYIVNIQGDPFKIMEIAGFEDNGDTCSTTLYLKQL